MKVYLIAPKTPESFWTFDRLLPRLGKRCVFPNLALPTRRGADPPSHEVVLCDENVEAVDFDTDADVVGITGFVAHKRRMFELAEAFRQRGKFVVAGGPFATLCPEEPRGQVAVLFVGEAEYHALGVPNIFVVDDNFIGNKKKKALLAALTACQEPRRDAHDPEHHSRGGPGCVPVGPLSWERSWAPSSCGCGDGR